MSEEKWMVLQVHIPVANTGFAGYPGDAWGPFEEWTDADAFKKKMQLSKRKVLGPVSTRPIYLIRNVKSPE